MTGDIVKFPDPYSLDDLDAFTEWFDAIGVPVEEGDIKAMGVCYVDKDDEIKTAWFKMPGVSVHIIVAAANYLMHDIVDNEREL